VIPAPETLDLLITAFEAPRDPLVEAWGRQVPVLLHERLARVEGVRARLALDPPRGRAKLRPTDLLLEGAVSGGEEVTLAIRLLRGLDRETILERRERFRVRELFAKLDGLAADVARALGAQLPPAPAPGPKPTSFTTLRDYLRAKDLDEDPDLPLELEDRRRKLEWLLLAVEADPAFAPAADALLEAGLRAHESGLVREARSALELLSRLQPRDARASYVLGELALMDGSLDEAAAHFRRCLVRDPLHAGASFRLGLLADEEGDREAAKGYFKTAGEAKDGRVEALLLLGILCAEDGERELAGRAWAKAAELDPEGRVGLLAQQELDRAQGRTIRVVEEKPARVKKRGARRRHFG
jgi:tetratricopeptide (TPR) repeat protein